MSKKREDTGTQQVPDFEVVESTKRGSEQPTNHSPGAPTQTSSGHKLTGETYRYCVQQLAQWQSCAQVARGCKAKHGVTVTRAGIQYFKRTHIEEIEAAREEYLRDFNDTPLAHRKVRVKGLVAIYHSAVVGLEDANNKQRGKSFFYALESLKLIKEEMEPVEVHIGKGSMTEVEELIDEMAAKAKQAHAQGQDTPEEP
jgi:hypothetical protein